MELVRLPKYVRIRTFAGLADEVVLVVDGPLEVLVRDVLDLAVEPLDGLRAELLAADPDRVVVENLPVFLLLDALAVSRRL